MPRFPTPWHPDAPQAVSWLLGHALDVILSPIPSPTVFAGTAQSEKARACSEKREGLGWTSTVLRSGLDLHRALMSFHERDAPRLHRSLRPERQELFN